MSIKSIHTEHAPAAIGPYSQAYTVGDFLFTSGQGGLLLESGKVVNGGIEAQAEQTMKNLQAILTQAETDFSRVVKANCYLADMKGFAAFNGVYEKFFVSKPARTCVAVRELPLGILCEVEIIAYLGA